MSRQIRVVEEQPKVRLFFLKKHDGASCVGDADKEKLFLEELLETFAKLAAHIYNTFDFYAVMGSGTDVTQIQLNQFTDLLDDCEIVEKDRVECNRAAMDSIFVVTNREDDQEEDTSDANDDRALCGLNSWRFSRCSGKVHR